jgi:hypothetical protein
MASISFKKLKKIQEKTSLKQRNVAAILTEISRGFY